MFPSFCRNRLTPLALDGRPFGARMGSFPAAALRLLLLSAFVLGAVPLHAATVESRVVWLEGKAQVEVAIDAKPLAGLKDVEVPLELFDAKGVRLWNTTLKVPVAAGSPWKARVALQNIKEPTKQHSLQARLHHDALGIDYAEEIWFGAETSLVQTHGLMTQGAFPRAKSTSSWG